MAKFNTESLDLSLAYLRDVAGSVNSVKGIRLNICDIGWRPPQPILARKILTETVTSSQSDKTRSVKINGNMLCSS